MLLDPQSKTAGVKNNGYEFLVFAKFLFQDTENYSLSQGVNALQNAHWLTPLSKLRARHMSW
jgi:hypothetical protein